jgi:hypothetical protein
MAAPSSAPAASAVPLGLLLRQDDEWELDVWAARRDRTVPPPELAWQPHLSMREWGVYRAQVLHFEDQVAYVEFEDNMRDHFHELPPGGFLDVQLDNDNDPVRRHLEQRGLWNDRCRIIHCAPDVAISAVALAQRLDRIPLHAEPPAIDFWVPDLRVDLPAAQPEGPHGWIAFTRGVEIEETSEYPEKYEKPYTDVYYLEAEADPYVEEETDPYVEAATDAYAEAGDDAAQGTDVDLYLISAPRDRTRYGTAVSQARVEDRIGRVRFSEGWRLEDTSALEEAATHLPAGAWVDVAATTYEVSAEPLAAARARALASALGLADAPEHGVYAFLHDGAPALYLMVRP